ncbi:hypothetical protein BS47DRAFT_1481693 [Hydnum rufescens UP504]|uniref:Ceramide very long chain fatty acid hydroxylase n=1 Tax=Hydnum rufescens UP504 TaxID=1448309 RepID=A0A9P6BA93_9AGAM|nr:hypothetical protein BS47DRAFT_1481693 [Hydnum rufescens UP504]
MRIGATQRIYTGSDVERHASKGDCWITRARRVYDVTGFLDDHPGGNDLILRHAGKDVGDAMTDPRGHDHSQAAYDILNQYAVGKIGATPALVNGDWVVTDHFHPNETSPDDDYEKNEFLDLNKPLIRQMFSRVTEWYVVPIVWLPIATAIFIRSTLQFSGTAPHFPFSWASFAVDSITAVSLAKTTSLFFVGLFLWTFFEYLHHRYLFHLDRLLPDTPAFLTAHFILHGIHHFLPMDRLRLVLPPTMFAVVQFPATRLLYALFSPAIANGLVSGLFVAFLHHASLPGHIREMKRYHLSHHYKNIDLGFGITTKLWDYVFNTVIV